MNQARLPTIRPVTHAAAVILAGGRSTRMGADKALLPWHDSTLLSRTIGVLSRVVTGPVVVVVAPGQRLPGLPARVQLLADPVPGQGPLAGLATGLTTLARSGVPVAFACSTDLPFLHPAVVAAVLAALGPDVDAAVPTVAGIAQPLVAGYRTSLGQLASRLVSEGERRATALLTACRVRSLTGADLLADPAVAATDPELRSLLNVNHPDEYRLALARPGPVVQVLGPAGTGARRIQAHTLGGFAAAAGVDLVAGSRLLLNGVPIAADPDLVLVAGDRLCWS